MNTRLRTALAALILAFAGQANGAEAADPQRLVLTSVDDLYRRTILEHGGIDEAVERLRVTAVDSLHSDRDRSNTWLTIAHLHWRHGQLADAVDATGKALDIHENVDGMLLNARLLDATGDADGATAWYETAAQTTTSSEEKDFIRLRLTMAQATNRNIDALVELAEERAQAFRNRAAITLALLGHPATATRLYEASEALGNPFRPHARLANWAMESGNFELAQTEAWRAYEAATTRGDRLYALALLVEAHRKNNALDGLLTRLARAMSDDGFDPDLLETRIDLLIETENYNEAIDFYRSMDDQRVDPASRRRLINLYQAAGRTDEMIAEYQQLMSTEPRVVHWYAGLAGHFLNVAQPDAALAVWHKLAVRNQDRVEVLTDAAAAMVQMGFVVEAVAMIEDHMAVAGESLDGLLFLFDLRHRRGEEEEALDALERLEIALGEGTKGIRDLADAYERLNKPDESIRILETLLAREGELGYDERIRLAWLYSLAGRKADAMAAWQDLWVSVESPARRNLAESQFLLLATELNKLGDIVVELEEKLILNEADRNEIGLLVRIYTEVGDSLSATEVIEEFTRYSGAGEVDRLRRLGRVHMMLADYPAYDKVLRQLVTADPDNQLEHIQNVVLNILAYDIAEESKGRFGEIQQWLGRLRELDAAGVSGEFEAGIYSMGGFTDEAIDSYRRALVVDPENTDNLLLLADLLKSAGRRDEAVAFLQYAAEHAEDDSAFVVAIDGIINMIGARSFNESLTPEMRDTFGWTRRVILERIAAHDGRFYLYQLLADIGQEVEDTQAAFVALENSLSEAGIRRPAVLRELVTLATPNAGFAGFTTGTGDAERQITHGRRLIGLKQALPPEVYINLGKALLETDAVQDAERAFDLIDDITGMIDIDRTKADVFHEAGYPDQALGAYTRALNVNRDDLSLLSRTAILREANGQDAVAHRLYFRALDNLLRSQPSTRPTERPGESQRPAARAFGLDTDTSVTRDYRQYFEALVQGFLITWPDSDGDASETTQAVKTMFDTELGAIAASLAADTKPSDSDSARRDLAGYPRLERTTWFANRVADRANDPALRQHVDSGLRKYFSTDDDDAELDEPLLHRQRDVAMREDDFETAVRLARVAGDEDGLLSLLRGRINAGKYRDGLGYARSLLDTMALRRLVAAIAPTLKDNKRAFAEAISKAPGPVLGIEAALGRELISPAELIDLLEDPEVVDNTDNPFVANEGLWRFIQAKLNLDQQVRYFAAIAARQEKSQFLASLPRVILHDLLAVDLTSTQADRLLAAGSELFNKLDLQMEFALAEALALFLNSRVIPANHELVYGLAEVVQQTTQIPLDLVATLKRILDGTDDESFAGLVEWEQAGLHNFGNISGAGERYEAIRERILVGTDELDDAIDDDRPDADFVRTVYEWEFPPRLDLPSPDLAARQATVLPGLIDRYPRDHRYGVELATAYLALGEQANIRESLFACYRRDPADKFLRAALYFHLRYQDQLALAHEVATDGGPDLLDAAVVNEMLEELRGKNRFQDSPGSRLFRQIYRGVIPAPPGSWSSDVEQSLDFLRLAAKVEDEATEAEAGRRALRAAWRGADDPDDEQRVSMPGWQVALLLSIPMHVDPSGRSPFNSAPFTAKVYRLDQLLDTDAASNDPKTLFEAVAKEPFSAHEFDRYLEAMPADLRRDEHRLYRLLVAAHDAAGTTERHLRDLSRDLDTRSDHDFTVWMLLRDRQDDPFTRRELAAFRAWASEVERPGELQIRAMARVFAKAGEFSEASQYYRWLAAELVEQQEYSTRLGSITYSRNPPLVDLPDLIREVAERLPVDVARQTVDGMVAAARRAGDHETFDAYFDAFLLKSLAHVYDAKDVPSQGARLSRDGVDSSGPTERWHAAKAAELVRSQARAGHVDEAIGLLRGFVTAATDQPGPDAGRSGLSSFELYRATMTMSLIYGFPRFDDFDGRPERVRFADLILYRERLFPSTPDSRWPGDVAWMTGAASAFVDWLDDLTVDATSTVEAALTVAWQLHLAGEAGPAQNVLENIATRIATDEDKPGLHHLARMGVRLGTALPTEVAKEALIQGVLTVADEIEMLGQLASNHDAATTLAIARLADTGDKLALMQFLLPLAETTGDGDHAADLKRRIQIAENARDQLGIELVSTVSR